MILPWQLQNLISLTFSSILFQEMSWNHQSVRWAGKALLLLLLLLTRECLASWCQIRSFSSLSTSHLLFFCFSFCRPDPSLTSPPVTHLGMLLTQCLWGGISVKTDKMKMKDFSYNSKVKLISRYPRKSVRVLNLGWESKLQILDFQETASVCA